MSRLGKKPVAAGDAKVTVSGKHVKTEGKLGTLELDVHPAIEVKFDEEQKQLVVSRGGEDRQSKALHGLTRSLLANMVEGVTKGYTKSLEVQGVGYRAELKGKKVELAVGYANRISVDIPDGVDVKVDGGVKIVVSGIDKQKVGQVAATLRRVRPPEPYKGKGVRYEGEQVKLKPGKAFGSK